MTYTCINPPSDERWLEFVSSNDSAFIHHHPAWLRVLSVRSNLTPQAFCSMENGRIVNGFIFFTNKDFATTLSGSSSNLILGNAGNRDEIITNFVKYMRDMNIRTIEIKDPLSSHLFHPLLMGYSHEVQINSSIDLINSKTTPSVSRNIRLAIRRGLQYEIRSDLEAVYEFYKLHIRIRKKFGIAVEPVSFFEKFYDEIISKGLGFTVSVKQNGIPMSSGLFAGLNTRLSYRYGASDPRYLHYRPNNLMIWAGLLEGQKRNFNVLDMGRTEKDNEGLRSFKLSWGCTETPIYYNYYPSLPQSSMLQHANKYIIKPIIQNSPTIVCRLTGKLVYKLFPMRFV